MKHILKKIWEKGLLRKPEADPPIKTSADIIHFLPQVSGFRNTGSSGLVSGRSDKCGVELRCVSNKQERTILTVGLLFKDLHHYRTAAVCEQLISLFPY